MCVHVKGERVYTGGQKCVLPDFSSQKGEESGGCQTEHPDQIQEHADEDGLVVDRLETGV